MKTFKFSLVLRTRENTDVFITLDDNIYGIHSKRVNILYLLFVISMLFLHKNIGKGILMFVKYVEGWVQDCSNSNIFLKPLFRGNFDPFVNNANLGRIAHMSNGT